MRKSPSKSAEQARNEFERRGLSVSEWARARGFNRRLVVYVLNGGPAHRGQAHDIAVALGIKVGVPRTMKAPQGLSAHHS